MAAKPKKIRLDVLLVEKGFAETRSQAQGLILAGQVLINEEPATKPGHAYPEDANLRVKEKLRYVSRGGLKLEKALKTFKIDPKDQVCLDIGASTGGFTDCLLQNGAKKVYAIDAGTNQLHWKLQTDSRVISFEKANFRHFDRDLLEDPLSLCVMDVSFISIVTLLPAITEALSKDKSLKSFVFLVKPQFEVGRDQVGKGGIVKDPALHEEVLKNITSELTKAGFSDIKTTTSPITGADGNIEFLVSGKFQPILTIS